MNKKSSIKQGNTGNSQKTKRAPYLRSPPDVNPQQANDNIKGNAHND
jgi:hypothetical protein